jgi:hypothetical protein
LQAVAWIRFGVDVPWRDDWRPYLEGRAGSLDVQYLFKPAAGTVYAVGKVMDSIVQRFLGGNVVIYQLLSMVILLGLLLLIHWALLRLATGDLVRTAVAFTFALTMLRAGTLWGLSSNAFQQGVPVCLVLAALLVVLRHPVLTRPYLLLIVVLGGLAGLTYVSGAFASLTAGIVLLLLTVRMEGPDRTRLRSAGIALLVAGTLTTAIQVPAILAGGGFLTWPWATAFWAYYFGLIGGSLALYTPGVSDAVVAIAIVETAVACVLVGGAFLWSVHRMARGPVVAVEGSELAIMLAVLVPVVGVYFALVAGARASFQAPPNATAVQTFIMGLQGHHPFWGTLLGPWLAAWGITLLQRRPRVAFRRMGLGMWAVGATTLAFLGLAVIGGAVRRGYDYNTYYSRTALVRTAMVSCLNSNLNQGRRLHCEVDVPAWDLTTPVLAAMNSGATFSHYLQFEPSAAGTQPTFRLSAASSRSIAFRSLGSVTQSPDGWRMSVQNGGVVTFSTGHVAEMENCQALEVTVVLHPATSLNVRVLFSSAESPSTIRDSGVAQASSEAGWLTLSFFLVSPDGFSDSLGVGFVPEPRAVDLHDVELHCRMMAR